MEQEEGTVLDLCKCAASTPELRAMVKLAVTLGHWRSVWWDRTVHASRAEEAETTKAFERYGRVRVCGSTGYLFVATDDDAK